MKFLYPHLNDFNNINSVFFTRMSLSFKKDRFGIKEPRKVDIPLNKDTKPNIKVRSLKVYTTNERSPRLRPNHQKKFRLIPRTTICGTIK